MALSTWDRNLLIEYQRGEIFHPYTCPRDHSESICLIPGKDAWFCAGQDCDYTQEYLARDASMASLVHYRDDGVDEEPDESYHGTEQERREAAYAHRGEVDESYAVPLDPRQGGTPSPPEEV